jgi:hypothetical protein
MALAAKAGHLHRGERVAMLGIGSGINCQMLGVAWQQAAVRGDFAKENAASDASRLTTTR